MTRSKIWSIASRIRYHIRRQSVVGFLAYQIVNIAHALRVAWQRIPACEPSGVALCLRFRDEARFLDEWLSYYRLAGVDHFFLYNNNSTDAYEAVLKRHIDAGYVSLIEWPRCPASPAAENDCIERSRGRFAWVGFLDADEFVVVRRGVTIAEYLAGFPSSVPGVALHWYYYGSAGHELRPADVLTSYTRRSELPNAHFKVFVRPHLVTRNRNSHNFYYRGARRAVREDGIRVNGSMSLPPSAKDAWVNHYYCKSLEDYLEKAARRSTLDKSGIVEPSRTQERARVELAQHNQVLDPCAIEYRAALQRRACE